MNKDKIEGLIKRLHNYALPDPHDEREVLHGPMLKEAVQALQSQQKRIEELGERIEFYETEIFDAACIDDLEEAFEEWKKERANDKI